MLFESLDKLKRNSILSSILLMTVGVVILMCPEKYIKSLTVVAGYTMLIFAIVMMLDFISSKRSLMDYLKFTGSLILALIGIWVLMYKDDSVRVLAWLFGFLLLCDGGRSMYHSLTFARRANRPGWWMLTIFSALLMITGIVIFANPWWDTTSMLMKVIGGAILFAALVSILRLIWTWPLRGSKGGNEDVGE